MPWNKDMNGNPKYDLSVYAKEELPTWNEVYNEFYKEKMFSYSVTNSSQQDMDPYWNIPHMKYIIMTVCNQFNKMIFEDGYKDEIIKFIDEKIHEEATDIMFLCRTTDHFDGIDFLQEFVYNNNYKPPIYTIPLPTGKPNPFIISEEFRVSSVDLVDGIWIFPLIISKKNNKIQHMYAPYQFGVAISEKEQEDFDAIIEFMMKPFKEYFEGEGVGWKDKDGHIVEGEPKITSCNGVGYDPAL